MDDFTLGLLANDEVLEIDQDSLCKQAVQVGGEGILKVYARPLEDGSLVGLFNLGKEEADIVTKFGGLKLTIKRVRIYGANATYVCAYG